MPDPHLSADRPDDVTFDFVRLVRRVVGWWPVIVACALAAGVVGYWSAKREPAAYSATALAQLAEVDLTSVVAQLNLQNSGPDADMRADTLAKLAAQPAVLAAAAKDLGLPPGELSGKVKASAQRNTTLVAVTATDGDPARSAAIANAVRDAFIAERRAEQRARLDRAEAGIRAQLAAAGPAAQTSRDARALRRRLERLQSISIVAGGGVEAAQRATVPTSPSSPRPKRTAMLALVLGGVLGVGLALVIVLLDGRVVDPDELAEIAGAPVLAVIPTTPGADPGRVGPSREALDALAIARAQLPTSAPGKPLTLLVTSAGPAEGKSVAAWSLAVASALAGRRVVYVEGDLRSPTLATRLGLAPTPGLAEMLSGGAEAGQVRRQVDVSVDGTRVRLDVAVAGTPPAAPAALLERTEAGVALEAIGRDQDLVVIDGPEALAHADARFLAAHCDGVLVVARLGQARRGDLHRLAQLAHGLGTPLVGVLANRGAGLPSWSRPSTFLSRRNRSSAVYSAAGDKPAKPRVE